jgi:hypothetical protein
MEIDKRAFVADLYPGPGWKTKVAKMPDEQVTAIFLREQAKAQQHTTQTKQKESGGDEIPF